MAFESYKASIPGSLMLFGEHAVLHGSRAIACAINRCINITLTPRSDKIIHINSGLLGECQLAIDNFKIKAPFQFVLTAIAEYLDRLTYGFNLLIESEFSDQIGFGSSAAVTVATLSVLEKWLNSRPAKPMELLISARKVIQKIQGIGSGADAAASVFGGIIVYQMTPLTVEQLIHKPPLAVVYSGSKVATNEVLQKVATLQDKYQNSFSYLYSTIKSCVENAIQVINDKDWSRLGELMNIHQGLQDAMGVNNEILAEIIFSLRRCPNICGAKISGAGLGDCVIGIGNLPNNYFPCNTKQKELGIRQINDITIHKTINQNRYCSKNRYL